MRAIKGYGRADDSSIWATGKSYGSGDNFHGYVVGACGAGTISDGKRSGEISGGLVSVGGGRARSYSTIAELPCE